MLIDTAMVREISELLGRVARQLPSWAPDRDRANEVRVYLNGLIEMGTTPSKADQLLASMWSAVNTVHMTIEQGEGQVVGGGRLRTQANEVVRLWWALDHHLRNGGAPPEAWAEGPPVHNWAMRSN